METQNLWSKTLLLSYRHLEPLCGSIDKIIEKIGISAGKMYDNAFSTLQKIIELSERKITLINLKLLIENTLSKIKKEKASILIRRFIDNITYKNLQEEYNTSLRTVFRKLNLALNSFSSHLLLNGFDDKKIENMVKRENWICGIHKKLEQESKNNNIDIDISIIKAIKNQKEKHKQKLTI